MKEGASLFIIDVTAGDGRTDGWLIVFDVGTKGLASGNMDDISFANGLVDGKAGGGASPEALDSPSDGLAVGFGDGMAFDGSVADIVGVKGDI